MELPRCTCSLLQVLTSAYWLSGTVGTKSKQWLWRGVNTSATATGCHPWGPASPNPAEMQPLALDGQGRLLLRARLPSDGRCPPALLPRQPDPWPRRSGLDRTSGTSGEGPGLPAAPGPPQPLWASDLPGTRHPEGRGRHFSHQSSEGSSAKLSCGSPGALGCHSYIPTGKAGSQACDLSTATDLTQMRGSIRPLPPSPGHCEELPCEVTAVLFIGLTVSQAQPWEACQRACRVGL